MSLLAFKCLGSSQVTLLNFVALQIDPKFKVTADFILLPDNPLAPPLLTLVDISYCAVLQNFLNKKYI